MPLTLTQLCGPPGAGKSTLAPRLGPCVVSADEIRAGAEPGRTMLVLWNRVAKRLREGQSVVIDTCALQARDRLRALSVGRQHGARCVLVLLRVSIDVCRLRDAARVDRARVNWHAVQMLSLGLVKSVQHEGWDEVRQVHCG